MGAETKTAQIQALMRAGNWRKAIAKAARLGRLDVHRSAILDAHNAYVRPEWLLQLKRNPDDAKAKGIAALKERFGDAGRF